MNKLKGFPISVSASSCFVAEEPFKNKPQPKPEVEEIAEDVSSRWYPVLDYERCTNCKQCDEFCMFGVYSTDSGTVTAAQPDNCKHGCPACARVCPEAAIMFPHYGKDAGIAGEPGATIASGPIDVDGFFKDRRPQPNAVETQPNAGDGKRDDLDDLIDQLDELDR